MKTERWDFWKIVTVVILLIFLLFLVYPMVSMFIKGFQEILRQALLLPCAPQQLQSHLCRYDPFGSGGSAHRLFHELLPYKGQRIS